MAVRGPLNQLSLAVGADSPALSVRESLKQAARRAGNGTLSASVAPVGIFAHRMRARGSSKVKLALSHGQPKVL